jgi:hypothetical protein
VQSSVAVNGGRSPPPGSEIQNDSYLRRLPLALSGLSGGPVCRYTLSSFEPTSAVCYFWERMCCRSRGQVWSAEESRFSMGFCVAI